VDPEALEVDTLRAAVILGFHPEHVPRLIRTGRLRARRASGEYQVLLNDLWPLLEVRYRAGSPPRRAALDRSATLITVDWRPGEVW
jgi:hypothetical protein